MIEKIQEFLFDLIGLLIPGLVILILVLAIPISMMPVEEITKFVDSENQIIKNIVNFYPENKILFYILVLCGGYIIGHTVKVFSKVIYEFFTVIFNKGLFVFVGWITNNVIRHFNKYNKFSRIRYICDAEYQKKEAAIKQHLFLDFLVEVKKFIIKILRMVFSFKESDYDPKNQYLIEDSLKKFNEKYKTKFPIHWYSVYKLSSVAIAHAGIKTLTNNFLAKYNFYRSMSFIFLTNFIYLLFCFSNNYNSYFSLLFILNIFLWVTFHDKYKRYWMLCGNESLVNFYYHIIRENEAEEGKDQ